MENTFTLVAKTLPGFEQLLAEELATLDKVFDDVCSCCDLFIDDKFNMAMNKYNRKN